MLTLGTGTHLAGASGWEGAQSQRHSQPLLGKASAPWRHCPARSQEFREQLGGQGDGAWFSGVTLAPGSYTIFCLVAVLFFLESGIGGLGSRTPHFSGFMRWEENKFLI